MIFSNISAKQLRMLEKILNNPGRVLEIAANTGTATASKNPKHNAATAPDFLKFVHQGKRLYLGKIQDEAISLIHGKLIFMKFIDMLMSYI